jgi:hypothetical protein
MELIYLAKYEKYYKNSSFVKLWNFFIRQRMYESNWFENFVRSGNRIRIALTAFKEMYITLSSQIGIGAKLFVTGCPELTGQNFLSGACMLRNFVLCSNYTFHILT